MTKNLNSSFVLASGSPRRRKLLKLFKFPFSVQPSDITEYFDANELPQKIVQQLATEKAQDIATRNAGAIVLGADTLVVHDENILGKPENIRQAREMLQALSGSSHHVFTGVTLLRTDDAGKIIKNETFFESTKVHFGVLDEADINRYVATGSPMDKAGAYGIQDDWGAIFVKGIEGDYYNIVGLPMHKLYIKLKSFAPELW